MDYFEKHLDMHKKNQNIFEEYKMVENPEIKISNKIRKNYSKLGKELLSAEKQKYFMEVRSINYYNVVMKKLEEYTFSEWLVCLDEKVLLEYAIPLFLRVLSVYPMLCGIKYEWQTMYEISKISQKFWQMNQEWRVYFQKIIENTVLEYEKGILKTPISDEYISQFICFKNM